MSFRCPDKGRVKQGRFATDNGETVGAFFISSPDWKERVPLKIIATNGVDEDADHGWEHVSVSLPHRCPTWTEMCHVKRLFWDDTDAVMQLHPPAAENISNHFYCLHLWRPTREVIPMPPAWMVGDKRLGTIV